ncbi:MAG TPA: hypothetical protein VIP98_00770 [Microlunatus sp.]
MFRKIMQAGAALAVVVAMLVVPAPAASAADGCGSGWYKESDGYLTKESHWQGAGSHNATIYHSGRVRFCTENDTFNDDENRRALIGYPSDSYPFESWIFKNGAYTKFCVRQTTQVHMTGIKSSDSWSISGTVSKSSPSVSVSYSATYDTMTVTVAKAAACGPTARQIIARTSGITVTADNESGKVDWARLTTRLTMVYSINGTKYVQSHSLVENDYS